MKKVSVFNNTGYRSTTESAIQFLYFQLQGAHRFFYYIKVFPK